MRRYIAALCLLTTALAATAQLSRYRADVQPSGFHFADTIGIEWEHGRAIVGVSADGRPYRFLLDTGASQGVVFEGSPLAAGPLAGHIVSHDAVGRSAVSPMVMLPPLRIGSMTYHGCCATVQPRSVANSRIDGILGFDLVNSGLGLKIDVPNRRMVITDQRTLFDREPGIRLKYRLNYHVPCITVTPFGRHRERVLVDTGSPSLFVMNKQHLDDAVEKERRFDGLTLEGCSRGSHAMGHLGTEREDEVAFLLLDGLRLGDYTFSGVHSVTTHGGSHIGAALLPFGAMAFSPRRRVFLFQPRVAEQPCVVDNPQTEIAFVDHDGLAIVGLVWEQGVPYRQGFRQGDIVEQIDHRPVMSFAQFAAWPFERGRSYTFTLRSREGQRRDVSWIRLP